MNKQKETQQAVEIKPSGQSSQIMYLLNEVKQLKKDMIQMESDIAVMIAKTNAYLDRIESHERLLEERYKRRDKLQVTKSVLIDFMKQNNMLNNEDI